MVDVDCRWAESSSSGALMHLTFQGERAALRADYHNLAMFPMLQAPNT